MWTKSLGGRIFLTSEIIFITLRYFGARFCHFKQSYISILPAIPSIYFSMKLKYYNFQEHGSLATMFATCVAIDAVLLTNYLREQLVMEKKQPKAGIQVSCTPWRPSKVYPNSNFKEEMIENKL